MTKKTFWFKQHDSCGRIIDLRGYKAETYREAQNMAYELAQKIHSHGVTYCDCYGKQKQRGLY